MTIWVNMGKVRREDQLRCTEGLKFRREGQLRSSEGYEFKREDQLRSSEGEKEILGAKASFLAQGEMGFYHKDQLRSIWQPGQVKQ